MSWKGVVGCFDEACRGSMSWRYILGNKCRGGVSWSMSWSAGYKFEDKVSWMHVVEHVVEYRVQV